MDFSVPTLFPDVFDSYLTEDFEKMPNTQLTASIAKVEKKFKDIERQNLIQNSLQNPKTYKEKCFDEPF